MRLAFSKMHGLGNDFVVVDATAAPFEPTPEQIRRLADRRRGVGCDQVLLVEAPRDPRADFRYRIFNADGGEVEMCGNGARCFYRFVRERGLSRAERLRVETAAGLIELEAAPGGAVRVNMGEPEFEPARIPFRAPARAPAYRLDLGGREIEIRAVALGNPHAVLRVDDVAAAPVSEIGPALEHHPAFPQRVNVGFAQVVDRGRLRLRVWERGAGETPACGSGACAAVAVGRAAGWLDARVAVSLPGGTLEIEWPGEGHPLWMIGPAETVFEGSIEL